MTYEIVNQKVQDRDADEITVIVTMRCADGTQADVWVCAGIPEWRRDVLAAATANGTWGNSRGYESAWKPGDSLDCWCPREFQEDHGTVSRLAKKVALEVWRTGV